MPKFRVPFTVDGYVEIEAETKEAAEDKFWEKYDDDVDGLVMDSPWADIFQDKPIREVSNG